MFKLVGFEGVDARQNVSVPIDGVDAIAFSGGDEGEMDRDCSSSFVGACKQTVLSHKNPAFNSSFTLIVINGDVRIFEKPCQGAPMIQRIVNSLHELMGWVKFGFSAHDDFLQALHERLRFSTSHCQLERWGLVFYVPFDFIQFPVHIENGIANILIGELHFEVLTSGMSAATGLDSLSVLEEGIETGGGIGLDNAGEILQEFEILFEGQIRRVIEHGNRVFGIADVSGNLAFSNIVLVLAVLDFNGGVIGFDNFGLKQLLLLQVVEQGECVGSGLHPIALCRAWNYNILASKDFLLTVIWKPIIELADNDFCQQARTGVAARNRGTWFFGSDDVPFAFGASAGFLAMGKDFQASADHLELMCYEVADENGFDDAIRADRVFGFNGMRDWLMREIFGVFENVLYAGGGFLIRGRLLGLSFGGSGARVVFFSLLAVVAFVTFFGLRYQCVDFGLQISEQFTQFVIAIKRLLQLLLQVFNQAGKALIFREGLEVLCLQLRVIVFHRGHRVWYQCHYTLDVIV